jgi:hypothetical protein
LCFGAATFQKHLVDGPLLLRIDEQFAHESLDIKHALLRRKLVRAITVLKKNQVRNFKVNGKIGTTGFITCPYFLTIGLQEKTLDEMDEYVMLLETHRIKVSITLFRFYAEILFKFIFCSSTVGGKTKVDF